MNIRPAGAELFHDEGLTDRQTDMTKLTVSFLAILRTRLNTYNYRKQNLVNVLMQIST